uniref:START domain-containing protein n=1 Tax=Timema bartmani TaxID=61472 RepID=A0A7R9EPX8_9NEOP|nr:unnamed protein product [Timema bartmani]
MGLQASYNDRGAAGMPTFADRGCDVAGATSPAAVNLIQDTTYLFQIRSIFSDVSPVQMYDVLHDPEYRKVWDQHMLESHDIGCLNPNNDVGYYAMSCPAPLKNRDFVLQRSWLDTGQEQYILNHSVYHKDFPPRRGLIRATSFLTGKEILQFDSPVSCENSALDHSTTGYAPRGFLVRTSGDVGCELGYVSQTDPQGNLPPWIVNRITQIFAPKMVKKLLKASRGYPQWKQDNNPNWKPWHYPEQITAPRITVHDCVKSAAEKSVHYVDETGIDDHNLVTYMNEADSD